MADEKQSGSWGGSFAVLAFAVVSAVYVAWQQPPLVSTRPTEPRYPAHELKAAQDLDARLWEDPFTAVTRDLGWRERDLEARAWHMTAGYREPDTDETLVLGVTLPGAPYPEVAETRRRLRYAVLSALHVAGYMPADEKHIGYWRPNDERRFEMPTTEVRHAAELSLATTGKKDSPNRRKPTAPTEVKFQPVASAGSLSATVKEDEPALPVIVPWEEFDSGHNHVLVLWLDEDQLTAGRQPIRSLAELRRLQKYGADRRFVLLGPEDSTTLAAMVREIHQGGSQAYVTADYQVTLGKPPDSLYNFGATADEGLVLDQIGSDQPSFEKALREVGIQYYRTVNSDKELAESLACELVRRGVHLRLSEKECVGPTEVASAQARDHIVLISDWDTVYGHDLSESVAQAIGAPKADAAGGSHWVAQISYLRGLDGRLPNRKDPRHASLSQDNSEQKPDGDASSTATQTAATQTAATPETASQFEGAEGQSQFDYLRRLADDLKHRQAEFVRGNEGEIAAIGVLGSDVYDKLLILQALRTDFPKALFFTTDFDALLLPQKKARYTRDLIVASSYGEQLEPKLQADIPPFRSTYQTSVFLATRLAIASELPDNATYPLDSAAGEVKTLAKSACWTPQPVMFQIGRTIAQPLRADPVNSPCGADNDGRNPAPGANSNIAALPPMVQPDLGKLYPKLPPGAWVSAGLLSTAMLLGVLFSFHGFRSWYFRSATAGEGSAPTAAGSQSPRSSADDGAMLPNPRPAAVTEPRYWEMAAISLIVLAGSLIFWLEWSTIARFFTENGGGEPMALFEGISLWPTIVVRALGAGLTIWMICRTRRYLNENKAETDKTLGVGKEAAKLREGKKAATTHEQKKIGTLHGERERIRDDTESYPTSTARLTALLWVRRIPRVDGERPKFDIEKLVGDFAFRWPARVIRAGIGTAAIFALWLILEPIFGEPSAPSRGMLVPYIYIAVTIIEVLSTLFLIFVVADAMLFSRAFILGLTDIRTNWPRHTVDKFSRELNLTGADLADWMDMQILAMRTRCITRLIYFPFIALAVLIISRSPLFDNFTTTWTLVITQALSVAIVIGSAVALRAAAEIARAVARENLSAAVIAASGFAFSGRAAQLEKLLEQIDGLNDGAFAPWSSQPIVKAVLLPLLTYGGAILVHMYALPGS